MFRQIALGAAVALSLAAGPVAAEPLDSFIDYCLQNNADRAAVRSELDKTGWFAAPAEEIFPEGEEEVRDPALHLNIDPGAMTEDTSPTDVEMVMTGWGDGKTLFDFPGVNMEFCAVMTFGGDPEAVERKLAGHFGFPYATLEEGERFWVFKREGDRLTSANHLLDLADAQALAVLEEGQIYMAGVTREEDTVILLLGAIQPAN